MKHVLDDCMRGLPDGSDVLDIGCLGFRQVERAERLGKVGLRHAGVDFIAAPDLLPAGFDYRRADLNDEPLPFDDDAFDLVIASHVVEHVREPIELITECVRVLRPGGRLYVEAPSERSLLMPGFPFAHDRFRSTSFFDDPTHSSRPWTPQAFVRLGRYLGCEPEAARHIVSWPMRLASPVVIPLAWLLRNDRLLEGAIWLTVGWACYLVLRKPDDLHGRPELTYYYPDLQEASE